MNKSPLYLLPQADDLGGSCSANRAIVQALDNGVLRNVSLMVTCEAAVHAARLLHERKDVCIGLHCVLNAEWDRVRWGPVLPAGEVPSLVRQDGTFHSSPSVTKEEGYDVNEIMAELAAQLAYARELGFRPLYADTHMRFEWIDERLPALFDAWCDREGLISYRKLFRELPVLKEPIDDPLDHLMKRLEAAGGGLWTLLTHPAFDDEEIRAFGNATITGAQIAAERDAERRLLVHPELGNRLKEAGITVVSYDEAFRLLQDRKIES